MISTLRKWVILSWLFLFLAPGCTPNKPIQIGFVAELTGHNSSLAVQGRNGAMLAVEDINRRGGVAGHKLEMAIRDDAGKKERLLTADQELINADIRLLTGHMTSWEAVTAYQMLADEGAILFSPTTSTPELSGKADHFFRLIPTNEAQSQGIADYASHALGLKRVAVLYDTDNLAYTQTFAEGFEKFFKEQGGTTGLMLGYSSTQANHTIPDLVRQIYQDQPDRPDGLLVIVSSFDAAFIAQQVRMLGWKIPIFSSNWGYGQDLIQNGGQAVEGMVISSHFNQNCQEPPYLDFKQQYETTYGQTPVFVSMLSYETIAVLAEALTAVKGNVDLLKEELSHERVFKGLCETIYLDQNGDARRNLYLLKVQNGDFTVAKTIEPSP